MPPGVNPAFAKAAAVPDSGVHPAILKQARKSGTLNLSNRSLTEGSINLHVKCIIHRSNPDSAGKPVSC